MSCTTSADTTRPYGIKPVCRTWEQPQTNGVAERFLRTLKEQVIYGRVFQNKKNLCPENRVQYTTLPVHLW